MVFLAVDGAGENLFSGCVMIVEGSGDADLLLEPELVGRVMVILTRWSSAVKGEVKQLNINTTT